MHDETWAAFLRSARTLSTEDVNAIEHAKDTERGAWVETHHAEYAEASH